MGPNSVSSTHKVKNTKFASKEFLHSIRPYWFSIIFSILLAVGSAVLGLFIPKILGDMTNIAVDSYPGINWTAIIGKAITVIVFLFTFNISAHSISDIPSKYIDLKQICSSLLNISNIDCIAA